MPQPFGMLGSPAIRIYQGETIAGQAWANAAIQLTGQFRIAYDDGTEDLFSLDRTAASATRSRTGLSSRRVAKTDGWVNSGSVWQVAGANNTTAAQRGGCYVQVGILAGAPADATGIFPEIRIQLARGYCYLGHPVAFGENVEAGPTSGRGHFRVITGIDPANGVLPVDTVPNNTIWRLIAYVVTLVTDATVGNRAFAISTNGNGAHSQTKLNNNTQAASLTRNWEWLPGTDQSTTVGASYVDLNTVLPSHTLGEQIYIQASDLVELLNTGALALTGGDNFASPAIYVEEWVIPGL